MILYHLPTCDICSRTVRVRDLPGAPEPGPTVVCPSCLTWAVEKIMEHPTHDRRAVRRRKETR